MVVDELSDEQVDRIFRALADATRRDILKRTLGGEVSVSALAQDYAMSFAAVQKHVAVLEGAGLVTKQPHGRERRVRANPETIRRAQGLLDQYEQIWRSRISQLDALLADDPLADDPLADDPLADDPLADDPLADDPLADDPLADDL